MTTTRWDPRGGHGAHEALGSEEPGQLWTMDDGDPRSWMRRKLFDLRIVLLSGPVDDEVGHGVGVELMTLDAIGDGPVHLQIDSAGGTLTAALALMDIIDVLGVPVRASCVGQAVGPSVGVLAVCSHRQMSAHARLRLLEPSVEVQGNARQLEQLASAHAEQWTAFCARLSEVTGQPLEQLLDDADRGRFFSAEEAIDYGLVDEVAAADARMYRLPGRPIGFGSV
ncbi:MAG: ATP-dependent Clp protease proteolytic subunit [Acidimicrobiales bacterium]|jgi:ATP-dependent Clp protease protease subunit